VGEPLIDIPARAAASSLEADIELGQIRVHRGVWRLRRWPLLNPLLAKSQYVGGMIGGIGIAIHELTMTDRATGPILGDTLANYLIPVHADVPEFDIAMIDEDDPHLPGSVKGFGMLGTAGIQAAIANAVFQQSGRECGACRSGLKI
jgi:xanthine dehydrogenase YagR molybdenum-binding subunit